MSVETERKIRIWILSGAAGLLLTLNGWGITQFVKSVEANSSDTKEIKETVIGFISKQTTLNDQNKIDHDEFKTRLKEIEKSVSKAELELYRITGKRIMETSARSSEMTEYEKIQKQFSQ